MTSADGTMALKALPSIPVKETPSFHSETEDNGSVDSFHLQLSDDEGGTKKGSKEEAEEEEILNRVFDKDDAVPDPEDEDKLLNGDVTEEESGGETKRCEINTSSEQSNEKTNDSESVSVNEEKNEEEKEEEEVRDDLHKVKTKDDEEKSVEEKKDGENEEKKSEEKEENEMVEDGEELKKQSISDEENKSEESIVIEKEALTENEESQTNKNKAAVEEAKKEDCEKNQDVNKAPDAAKITIEENTDVKNKDEEEADKEEEKEKEADKKEEEAEKEEKEIDKEAKVADKEEKEADKDAKEADEEGKEENKGSETTKDSESPEEPASQEILKNQVMDPEDLLQMVDKETDENDKDSSENSPRNAEETTETEKMDVDDSTKVTEDAPDEKEKEDEVDSEEEPSTSESDSESEIDTEDEDLTAEEMEKDLEKKDSEEKEPKEPSAAMEVSAETKPDEAPSEQATNEEAAPPDTNDVDGAENKIEPPPSSVTILDEVTGETKSEVAADDKERSSSKRLLSDPDEEAAAKRIKTQDEPAKDAEKMPVSSMKTVALNAIDEYLKLKSLKTLTYRDLEQIILQKMCEAICHKSEIGELRHQLGVQEQMAEMWRKEVAQLTKQARDLEIVNKRLLHEVRLKNERDKPLIPVRITRSVGLQVRSDTGVMNNVMNNKRKINRTLTTPAAKQSRTITPARNQTVTRVAPQNKIITPSKTVTAARPPPSKTPVSPIKKASPAKPLTLLSKALQNSTNTTTATTSTPVMPTTTVAQISIPSLTAITTSPKAVTTTTKAPKQVGDSKTVIDLTDEDDKKVTTSQGIRIVSAPVKTGNVVTTAGVVNPPRIMYVYNNQLHQGVLAADPNKPGQKLMLKLNSNVIPPGNGVIAAAVTTGSAIAVSSSSIRPTSVQPVKITSPVTTVRTSSPASKAKHPAPLPHPPPNQYCMPSRKPIPPKPQLSIKRSNGGLVLSWKMPYILENYETIASYQLYAYQETTSPPSSDMWRKVGDVKALALPMACTLTQFADGNKYHFAVRAVDVLKRLGPFSDPEQILL